MNHAQLLLQMNRYRTATRVWDVKHRLWQAACAECKALVTEVASKERRVASEVRRAELHRELVGAERAKDISANFVALALFDCLGLDVSDCSGDVSLEKVLAASLRVSQL